jgi:hypothetical protein
LEVDDAYVPLGGDFGFSHESLFRKPKSLAIAAPTPPPRSSPQRDYH